MRELQEVVRARCRHSVGWVLLAAAVLEWQVCRSLLVPTRCGFHDFDLPGAQMEFQSEVPAGVACRDSNQGAWRCPSYQTHGHCEGLAENLQDEVVG